MVKPICKHLRLLYGYIGKWYSWLRISGTKMKVQLMSTDQIPVELPFTISPTDQCPYLFDYGHQSAEHNSIDVVPAFGTNVDDTSSLITL